MALTVVPKGDKPAENVVAAHFRRPSTADQLRLIADSLDQHMAEGLVAEPDYMVVVFGSDDLKASMSVQVGGAKDAHPYLVAGMLQNAALCGLDEAAYQSCEEEQMD